MADGVNKDGLVVIDKELYNEVLKAADIYVETRTNISDNGITIKSEEVKAAEELGEMIISAVENKQNEVYVEDYKVEFLKEVM